MIDDHSRSIGEQLTLRKLEYARRLLESAELHYGGNRAQVRERLIMALEDGSLTVPTLQRLLDELDAWGDQRIRFGRIPPGTLKEFQSADSIARKAKKVEMAHLLQGKIALIPPLESVRKP